MSSVSLIFYVLNRFLCIFENIGQITEENMMYVQMMAIYVGAEFKVHPSLFLLFFVNKKYLLLFLLHEKMC